MLVSSLKAIWPIAEVWVRNGYASTSSTLSWCIWSEVTWTTAALPLFWEVCAIVAGDAPSQQQAESAASTRARRAGMETFARSGRKMLQCNSATSGRSRCSL